MQHLSFERRRPAPEQRTREIRERQLEREQQRQATTGTVPEDTFEMKPHQRELAQTTGISSRRFDPNYWQNSEHGRGARPPDKIIWDSWTPEQRAQAGLPTWESYKEAARAWRSEVGALQAEQNRAIVHCAEQLGLNLRSEGDFIIAMHSAGILDRADEGRAGFRRRLAQFRGEIDSSGRYQFMSDGRTVDVGTSDLAVRGRPIMRPHIQRRFGPAAALGDAYSE